MATLQLSFVSLLLVCAVNVSRSLESAQDQYKANKDMHHPLQFLSEATDKAVVDQNAISSTQIEFPKLETYGKLESLTIEHTKEKEFPLKNLFNNLKRHRRSIDNSEVNKRNAANYYNPWNPSHVSPLVQVPPVQSFSVWQPQRHRINRPYYIPVFGSPGKLIYFAPQPIYLNPGFPADNKPNREYLPPKEDPGNGTISTNNKFGEDPPIWEVIPGRTTPTTVRPTRRTRRPGQARPTHPPLIHNGESNEISGNKISPATTTPRVTTNPPKEQIESDLQPSRCIWAIISCCAPESEEISYDCFEQLQCNGAFWGSSPCESEFARAAINTVMKYYNTNG